MKKIISLFSILICCIFSSTLLATTTVKMYSTKDKSEKYLGTITFKNTLNGLQIMPDLKGLSQGMHGLHLHEKADCGNQGAAASSHYDPKKTHQHLGPYSIKGELGDLPTLYVDQNGVANKPIFAPRLTESNLKNLSVIIHANDDNYSDVPKKVGGSGERIACGVIK